MESIDNNIVSRILMRQQLDKISFPVDVITDRINFNRGENFANTYMYLGASEIGDIIAFTDEKGDTRIMPGSLLLMSALDFSGYRKTQNETVRDGDYRIFLAREVRYKIQEDIEFAEAFIATKRATRSADIPFQHYDKDERRYYTDIRRVTGDINEGIDINYTITALPEVIEKAEELKTKLAEQRKSGIKK